MKRIAILATALVGSLGFATQANAWFFHKHYCNCGDATGAGMCTSTSSTSGGTTTTSSTTSGGTTTTSGGTTTTSSTTSGGTTSTSGGTDVPEPGMLGMMGLGFIGLAAARRRRRR